MQRRTFGRLVCSGLVLGVAGCLGAGSSDGPDDGENAPSTPAATPEPTPAPDGTSYDFEGNGDFESEPITLDEGLLAVDHHHWGHRHNVEILAVGEDHPTILLNEYYENGYDGTDVMYVEGGEYRVIVDSGSQWTTTVRQPRYSEAEYEQLPYEVDGSDHTLVGPFDFTSDTTVTLSAETERIGSVDLFTLQGNRVTQVAVGGNGEPNYEISGTVEPNGPGLLHVITADSWTLTVEPE